MSGFIDKLHQRSSTTNECPRVLDVQSEETDEVLDALASDTARRLLRSLFEEPRTPSELAHHTDTSVQNINYHLMNLREAGLTEAVDTQYSKKGREMTVYGPTSDPLVFVSNHELRPAVDRSLRELVAGLGILVGASVLVQWGTERLVGGSRDAVLGPASWGAPDPGTTLAWVVFGVVEPGVLFFFGCLLVVAALALTADA
ncbi:ArsR/SmtB family transcription factor [Haloprofundus salilacus]|uniref:ArsR/SmtB family transcription factor n=1 Tax=Haloprofundus salilacus TaxID=2876190 RepID=UPI001CCEA407|nr:winged helix-turn-helix domain-containing protein [Haloprofundus salilacus]